MQQELTIYDAIEAGISELKQRHENVVIDVTTTKGMNEAIAGRAELRFVRLNIEKARKEGKEESLAYGRRVDAKAKEITAQILPLEENYHSAIKAEEERKEKERFAKQEAERQRNIEIQKAINTYRMLPVSYQGKDAESIEKAIFHFTTEKLDESVFVEFTEAATQALAEGLEGLRTLLKNRIAFDQQQAELKAAQEALEKDKAEAAEREKASLALALKEQAEAKAKADAEQAVIDAERKAVRDAELAELKKQREAVEEKERLVNEAIKKQAEEDAARRKVEADRLKRLYDNAALMLEALENIYNAVIEETPNLIFIKNESRETIKLVKGE